MLLIGMQTYLARPSSRATSWHVYVSCHIASLSDYDYFGAARVKTALAFSFFGFVSWVLCIVYSVLFIVYCVLCIAYCVLYCTVYCVV